MPEELAQITDMPMFAKELKADMSSLFADRISEDNLRFDSLGVESLRRINSPVPSSKPVSVDSYFVWNGIKGLEPARCPSQPRPVQWLGTLFPSLPPLPRKEIEEPECTWPKEALQLAQSLLRTDQLAKIDSGARIDLKNEYFDTLHETITSQSETSAFVSPNFWLVRAGGNGSQTLLNWCDTAQRGVLSKAFLLGRLRKSTPKELEKPPLGIEGYTLNSLEKTYRNYEVQVQQQADGQRLLTLKHPGNADYEIRILVDTKRHVITKIENYQNGKTTSTATFGNFVRWADAWWAGSIERTDAEGRRVSRTSQTFKPLSKDEFGKETHTELADRAKTQFIEEPLVSVKDAKGHIADGKASFDDQLVMLLYFSATQQWERALEHLHAAEKLAVGKTGMHNIHTAVLNSARLHEEVKKRYFEDARSLAKDTTGNAEALFLADYIRGQAAQILQQNEMLELLDVLKPVYEHQPPFLHAAKRLAAACADYLQQANRTEDEVRLRKQLATDYPTDANLQQRYAQRLFQYGEQEAALAWLDAVLAKGRKWHAYERENLHNVRAQFLREQGRYAELAEYLSAWIEESPETNYAYAQYLTALIRTDREKDAHRLMAKWFKDARDPQAQNHGRLVPEALARLNAAISQALGQGYNLYTNRLDERWHNSLEQTALYFAEHRRHADITNRIMQQHNFQGTDACRRVRKKVTEMLLNRFEKLSDAQVDQMVRWITPNDPAIEADTWKKIAALAKKRWNAQTDADAKHRLGAIVQQIMPRVSDTESLAFQRLQYKQGPEKYRAEYARCLFNALLSQQWSEKFEDEAFALLDKLSDSKEPAIQLASQIDGLQRLTDRMVQTRYEARMKTVEHPEKLTRTELRDKKAEALRLARESYADRLKQRARKLSKPLCDWFTIERLYIDIKLERDLQRVAEECWELLDSKPRKQPENCDDMQTLRHMLQNRVLVTLSNLAARNTVKPELAERLLDYLDRGIAIDADNPYWQQAKYRMLIALDRPEQLETVLRSWIKPDSADNHWRVSLAYLLAEQGKLAEAITMLETVEKADELRPADYRALSGWYMAEERREQYRRVTIESFKTTDEWRLGNWIEQQLRPWQRNDGHIPAEMHKDVPLVFIAIFEKSGNPAGHLWRLQQFYQSTHDFRLLACLADAMVGHTAGKVYPFLQGAGGVLSEVRDEATADSIVEHLEKTVRPRAKSEVDRRALDLLELLVERRAAELLNQPGPHAQRALDAMQRAFKREWSEGEPRLMADLLAGMGRISQPELAAEQRRELEVLHQRAAKGSADRLHIAHRLAETLWHYNSQDRALDLLADALTERQNACDGILPATANGPLECFVSYLESKGHFARAESFLKEQLAHPVNQQQKLWLTLQLFETYEVALQNGGQVSLGNGETLYKAVQKAILDNLATDNHNHRRQLIERLLSIYRTVDHKRWLMSTWTCWISPSKGCPKYSSGKPITKIQSSATRPKRSRILSVTAMRWPSLSNAWKTSRPGGDTKTRTVGANMAGC